MAALHFDITGDNKGLLQSLQQAQNSISSTISTMTNGGKVIDAEMKSMGNSVEDTLARIAKVAGGIFAVGQIKEYLSQVIDVRKEFQSIELSFTTLMGSETAGKKLFQDITQFATTTPMLEKDLAKAAQTLLGFNIEAGKVMPILRQIGDISMGDSQKMESLTLAFAQASSTGKLMGQDLLQMINAGFNPLVEISRTTGRSLNDLKDAMSKGEISIEMLQNAFKTATEEGGKFHGMLNGMAQGMQGAFSNLEGAIQKLYNDAGQKIETPLVEGANAATEAINKIAENIDAVTSAIETAIVAYGSYKAITMTVAAAQAAAAGITSAAQAAELAQLQQVISLRNLEVNEEGKAVIVHKAALTQKEIAIAAAKEEAAAVLASIQLKAKEAAENLSIARSEQAMAMARLSSAEQGIIMRERDLAAAIARNDAIAIETAENNLNTASLERNAAAKAAKVANDRMEAAQIAATNASKIAETAATTANTVAETSNAAATGVLAKAKLALSGAIDKVTASMAKNPYTVAAIAIAALIVACKKLYDNFQEQQAQQEKLKASIEKTANAGKELNKNLSDLSNNAMKSLQDEVAATQAKYKTLQAKWKECNGDARFQKRFINDNKNAFHELGFEVNSVSDAEKLLVKNTDVVVAALQARAEAAAYQQLATEAYKKQISAEINVKNNTSKYRKATTSLRIEDLNDYEKEALTQAWDNGKVKRRIDRRGKNTLTKQEADWINNFNRQRMLTRRNAALGDIRKDTSGTIEKLTKGAAEARKKADNLTRRTGVKTYDEDAFHETDKEKKEREKAEAAALKEANEAAQDAEKLVETRSKAEREAERNEADTLLAIQQYTIDAMADGSAKKIAQIRLDNAKEIEAIKRAKEDAILVHEQAAKELWEAEHPNAKDKGQTWENTGRKGKTFTLTSDEKQMFAAREKAAGKSMQRQLDDEKAKRLKAQYEYLAEYGNYEEKRNAIHAKYEAERNKLEDGDEYSRKLIDAKEREELNTLQDTKQVVELDWSKTFAHFDEYTSDYLIQLQTRLNDALSIATEKNATLIREKIDEIDNLIRSKKYSGEEGMFGSKGFFFGSSFGKVYQTIQKQKGLELQAQKDQGALEAKKIAILQKYGLSDSTDLKNITSKNKELASKISTEDLQALGGLETTSGMSGAMASAGAAAAGPAATEAIIKGINQNIQSFREAADMIWGKDSEMAKSVNKFADSSQYATDAFDSLKSGDFVGTAMNLGKAVNKLGESFGIWSNSNREEVEKANEKLASAMAVNTEALNRLTDKMSEGTAVDKANSYEQAVGTMQANEQADLQTMINNAGMYDGGHSLSYDFYDKYEGSGLRKRLRAWFGRDVGGLNEILSLDPKEVNKLYNTKEGRQLITDITQMINDAADDGNYGNQMVQDWLNHLSTYSEEAYDALYNKFRENVTKVSFDSFKDEFKSTLMDMDADSTTFADNFTKKLTQSFLDAQIEKLYDNRIQSLYTEWSDALTGDNKLSAVELARIKSKQDALTADMLKTRDEIAAITGYDDISSREANGSINAAKSMSEDTANELVGRVTAVQLGVEGIKAQENANGVRLSEQLTQGIAYITTVSNLLSRNNDALDAMLQQQVIGNNYLADIANYNRNIYDEWSGEISAIRKKIQTM